MDLIHIADADKLQLSASACMIRKGEGKEHLHVLQRRVGEPERTASPPKYGSKAFPPFVQVPQGYQRKRKFARNMGMLAV
jgi:hypothetical protein